MKIVPKVRAGGWAWIALAVGVSGMDYALIHARRATMSEVFGAALRHPMRRWPVIVAWTVLTLHLFGCILPQWMEFLRNIDPISAVARLLTPK